MDTIRTEMLIKRKFGMDFYPAGYNDLFLILVSTNIIVDKQIYAQLFVDTSRIVLSVSPCIVQELIEKNQISVVIAQHLNDQCIYTICRKQSSTHCSVLLRM